MELKPKPCKECRIIMHPGPNSRPYDWGRRLYCVACKQAIHSRGRTEERKEAKEKIRRGKESKARITRDIIRLLRIKWTHSWWEHE